MAMGKPLFKAPDGGYYERVRVTKDSTQSGLQQGLEASVLVEQMVENLCNIWDKRGVL